MTHITQPGAGAPTADPLSAPLRAGTGGPRMPPVPEADRPERRELLQHRPLPDGYAAERKGAWVSVVAPGRSEARLRQGWKLHVSARPESLEATFDRALPVLLEAGCDFKVIAGPDLLREFNAGLYGTGAVGKALTVYPAQDRVGEIALRLADVLRGFEGPQINSDRRVRPDAPVYYRFGPFAAQVRMDDAGRVDIVLKAPDGRVSSGVAGDTYSPPEWARDPFGRAAAGDAKLPRVDGAIVIGDHYRITSAIMRTYRGSSYRAIDVRSGQPVIVKESRAFVNETVEGDAREYLRNERRILTVLDGVPGVPRVIDHFAYGKDEFLVMTDLGPSNLRDDIVDRGVFAWESAAPRNVLDLGRAILLVLDAVHQRGVVFRDLAPKNVVALADGGWGLVDFELSRCDGVQRYGWSAGYSHVCQRRNEPARVEDDYYSLGATLFHAVTGIDPIVMDQDPDANVVQTLSCLTAVCGAGAPVVGLVRDLLDADPAVRSSAVRRLRATTVLGPGRPVDGGSPPDLSLAPILRHTLGVVLGHAEAILAEDVRKHVLPPPVSAYEGLAGLVMELARHPEALTAASQLARLTAFVVKRVESPPALLYGRMGVSLALQAVASAGGDPALQGIAESILPGEEEVANERRVDVTHGLAGLGLGYLEFAAGAPDPGPYLGLADRCAERLLFGEELIEGNLRALPVGDPAHGISVADGFAHGRAGIAYFLLAHAAQTGYPKSRQRARRMMDQLADLVPDLAGRARSRLARPMAASWCQGLAGIGTALVRGARFFADDRLLTAARTAAAGCRSVAPRVPLVTQCCGLAGIGEFLLDLAIASGDTSHRQDAIEVLHLMLTRSGGPRTAPSFPDATMAATTPCWATGASGVLSFLRRLADPSSPRLWMADGDLCRWPR